MGLALDMRAGDSAGIRPDAHAGSHRLVGAAAVRPMFFSQTSDGKTLNGRSYPHPPLVFVLDGEHGLQRPRLTRKSPAAAASAIAIAPILECQRSGSVCLGSMATPRSAGLASLGEVGDGLLSKRIHACWKRQHHEPQRRPHSASGVIWPGGRAFPPEWLIPAGTLEDWLCRRS